MGLLDSYANLDDVSASTFDTPPANTYEYVVKGVSIKEGSAKNPDVSWVIVEYILNDGKKDYSYSEFFKLPEDQNRPTEREVQTLSRYLSRLVSLGLTEDEAKATDGSDVEGLEGVLSLTETKRGDQTYTNVRNVRAGDRQTKEAPKPAAAPIKRRAAKVVEPEPVDEEEVIEEADEAEEEAVEAPAESVADRLALRRRRLQSTAATSRSNNLAD